MPRGNAVAERQLGAVVTAGTDVSTRQAPAFREARPSPTRAKAFVLGRFFRRISRHRACSVRPTALALLARSLGHGEAGFLPRREAAVHLEDGLEPHLPGDVRGEGGAPGAIAVEDE